MMNLRKHLLLSLLIIPVYMNAALDEYVDEFMNVTALWGSLAGALVGTGIASFDGTLNYPQLGFASLATGGATTFLVYKYRNNDDIGKNFAPKSAATVTAVTAAGLTMGAILLACGKLKSN